MTAHIMADGSMIPDAALHRRFAWEKMRKRLEEGPPITMGLDPARPGSDFTVKFHKGNAHSEQPRCRPMPKPLYGTSVVVAGAIQGEFKVVRS